MPRTMRLNAVMNLVVSKCINRIITRIRRYVKKRRRENFGSDKTDCRDLADGRDKTPFRLAFTSYKLLRTIHKLDANIRAVN
jgi:hypothetical protein